MICLDLILHSCHKDNIGSLKPKILTIPSPTIDMGFLLTFLYSQYFVTPPVPDHDFTGKTVIVTGSNTGLGFEAARHFARLNCKKLILAVRTISKGEKAKESILASTKRTLDCIEVWDLDLSSIASVKAFAKRAQRLERVDVLIENAGSMLMEFKLTDDGNEISLQTNVISTFLLALLMLPKLRETSERFQNRPRLAIVSSELYQMAALKERNEPDIYATLNDPKRWSGGNERYGTTKLLEVFFVRELASRVGTSHRPIITAVNPGFCYSDFRRNISGLQAYFAAAFEYLTARTTEVGSRNLVAGGCAAENSHGEYMADSVNQALMGWASTGEGRMVQKRVYEQSLALLEKIEPGISGNV